MSRTLNDLIAAAIGSAEDQEETVSHVISPRTVAPVHAATAVSGGLEDVEKIATVLEFIGRRGVESLVKQGSAAPPPGTDDGKPMRMHMQSQEGPHGMAPPMKSSKSGPAETNMAKKPGSGAEQADGGTAEVGTHHASLSSNEAAAAYQKTEKAKLVSPALSRMLQKKPYTDTKAAENVSNAEAGGDKNINKQASAATDRDLIKLELARRAAGRK